MSTTQASIDISPIVQAVVGICATGLSVIGGLVLTSLAKKFNLQISAAQSAAYSDALNKGLAYGVTALQSEIAAKGWDHVETQSKVVAAALDYAVSREPAALAAVGMGSAMNDPGTRAKLTQAITARLPAAYAVAAASPATPPATAPAL